MMILCSIINYFWKKDSYVENLSSYYQCWKGFLLLNIFIETFLTISVSLFLQKY